MTDFTDAAKAGGNRMRIFGVIAIILGILCLLAPGLTGVWALTVMGLFVLAAGIVRMIWAFQAGSFGKGLLMFAIGGLTLLCCKDYFGRLHVERASLDFSPLIRNRHCKQTIKRYLDWHPIDRFFLQECC